MNIYGQSTSTTYMSTPSPSHVTCYDVLTYNPVLPNLQHVYKEAIIAQSIPKG